MPDSMCDNEFCRQRKTCYRFMATPNEFRQSYLYPTPKREKGVKCEYYYPIKKKGKT